MAAVSFSQMQPSENPAEHKQMKVGAYHRDSNDDEDSKLDSLNALRDDMVTKRQPWKSWWKACSADEKFNDGHRISKNELPNLENSNGGRMDSRGHKKSQAAAKHT